MISIKKHAVRIFLLSVISLLIWGCGGGTPKLKNGETKDGLSGTAGAVKTYSITLPSDTQTLLLTAFGSSDVTLTLKDGEDLTVMLCSAGVLCHLGSPPAGTYTLEIRSTTDYSGVSIAASWGAVGDTAILNDEPLSELAFEDSAVVLKSLRVESFASILQLNVVDVTVTSWELLDELGSVVHTCSEMACEFYGVDAGYYYLRGITSAAAANGSLVARWGSELKIDLENGIPLHGLAGTAGQVVTRALTLTESSNLMLLTTVPNITLQVHDLSGAEMASCVVAENPKCSAQDLEAGVYIVKATLQEDVADFALLGIWTGAEATLQFGSEQLISLQEVGEVRLDTIEIAERADAMMLMVGGADVDITIVSPGASTSQIKCNEDSPCILNDVTPGLYPVITRLVAADDLGRATATLYFAMAGQQHATLNHGGANTGPVLNGDNYYLESFYVTENNSSAFFASGNGERVTIYDVNGNAVAICSGGDALCSLGNLNVGSYFAVADVELPKINQASTALLLNPASNPTLQAKIAKAGLDGEQGSRRLESFAVPEDTQWITFAVSEPGLIATVYDESGLLVAQCNGSNLCIHQHNGSAYYTALVEVENIALFEEATYAVNTNYAAAGESTLISGTYVSGPNAIPGSVMSEIIVVPDAVEYLNLWTYAQAESMFFEQGGNEVFSCARGCFWPAPSADTYFIRMDVTEEFTDNPLSASIAYAGEQHSTLIEGELKSGITAKYRDSFVQSFYVPDGIESVKLHMSDFWGDLAIIDPATGRWLRSCYSDTSPCDPGPLPPGPYFTFSLVDYVEPIDAVIQVGLTMAYAGTEYTSLAEGELKIANDVHMGDRWLQSFRVTELTPAVQIVASTGTLTTIFDVDNAVLTSCEGGAVCTLPAGSTGIFYLSVEVIDPLLESVSVGYNRF